MNLKLWNFLVNIGRSDPSETLLFNPDNVAQLDSASDQRPFFTWWISTVWGYKNNIIFSTKNDPFFFICVKIPMKVMISKSYFRSFDRPPPFPLEIRPAKPKISQKSAKPVRNPLKKPNNPLNTRKRIINPNRWLINQNRRLINKIAD